MKSPSLISILVPAYNHEKYVETCIRSVLEQDWPRLELIVIDDGSRDGTWQVLQGLKSECERRCERVIMQTQENQGTCVTGNRLYDLMRGEFCMTIASDDALLPGALSALAKPMLQDPEVGAVVGQNVLMDDAGRLFYWRKGGTVTYDEKEALTITTNGAACGCFGIDQFGSEYGSYATLARGNYIANGCLFRTAALNRVARFTTEAPLEDYWIHLQVSKVARYRSIPERTFRYRWHAGNTSKQHGRLLAMTSKTIDYEERLLRQAGDVRHLTDLLVARHPKRWETRWLKLRRRLSVANRPPPLISILIPAYNHEKYVEGCVRSVLAQDWPNVELLVVDDGSSDATWAKLQGLKAECERRLVRVEMLTQENRGTFFACARLRDMARGEFILPLASDDELETGALSALVGPMLKDRRIGVVVGQNAFMDSEGRTCYWNRALETVYDESEARYRSLNEAICSFAGVKQFSRQFGDYGRLLKNNYVANGYLIRASELAAIEFPAEQALLDDYWMHLQLSKRTRYRAIRATTFRYRWHQTNTSHLREKMREMTRRIYDLEEELLRATGDARHLAVFRKVRGDMRPVDATREAGPVTVNLDYMDPALARQTEFEASFAYFSDRRLSVTAYDAALVLPGCPQGGGVIDADGRLVACSVVQNGWPKGGLYAFDRKEVVDEEVVYLGMFYSCWGHVITDNLKHLWFRMSPEVDARIKRLKFVYTTTHIGPEMPENFKEMLRLLGLEFNELVRIERPTQFRRVYVPEPCFGPVKTWTPYRYTKEYAEIVERLLSAAGAEPGPVDRSVYFTRTGWKLDRAEGEKRIETVFRDLGYEIVRPETLSFVQMVRLLSRVRNFAATDGSCAHNALFLRKGSRAVVIRKAAYSNFYQAIIGQVRELETVYVDANRSDMLADDRFPVLGPFFLYVNERLARFAGVRPRFPVFAYLRYALPQLPRKLFRKIRTPRK